MADSKGNFSRQEDQTAQESALGDAVSEYARLCIQRCRGNSYSKRSFHAALRRDRLRFDPKPARKMLLKHLEKVHGDSGESALRREGAGNMLVKIQVEAIAEQMKRAAPPPTASYSTVIKNSSVSGIAGPAVGGSHHLVSTLTNAAAARELGGEQSRGLHDSEPEMPAADDLSEGASVAPRGRLQEVGGSERCEQGGTPAVAQHSKAIATKAAEARMSLQKAQATPMGLARRVLKAVSPNLQRGKNVMVPAPHPSERSTARSKRARQPEAPNVACSSDAMCNFASPPMLPGQEHWEECCEEGAASGQQSEVAPYLARALAQKKHFSCESKRRRRCNNIENEDNNATVSVPAATRLLEALGTVVQLEKEMPDPLKLLPATHATVGPANQDAANGAQNLISAFPPRPKSLTALTIKRHLKLSPPKATVHRNASIGALAAKSAADLPLSNRQSKARPKDSVPASQLKATRVGGKLEAERRDHAVSAPGLESRNKVPTAEEASSSNQHSLLSSSNPFDSATRNANRAHLGLQKYSEDDFLNSEARAPVLEIHQRESAVPQSFESLPSAKPLKSAASHGAEVSTELSSYTAAGPRRETKVSSLKGRELAAVEGEENCPVSSAEEALAAVKLADTSIFAPDPAPPLSSRGLLKPGTFLQAPSTAYQQEEGRLVFQSEQETEVTPLQAVNKAGLAVPRAQSVKVPDLNAVPEGEELQLEGFEDGSLSPEDSGRNQRKRWTSLTNPLSELGQVAAFEEQSDNDEDSSENEHTAPHEISRRSRHESWSIEAYKGPMAAQNEQRGKAKAGAFGSHLFSSRDPEAEEEPSSGMFRPSGTSWAGRKQDSWSDKLEAVGLGRKLHSAGDDENQKEPFSGPSLKETSVSGLSWLGGKAREIEKEKASASSKATGLSADEKETAGIEKKPKEQIRVSLRTQQLEALGLTQAAADRQLGPFHNGATCFPKSSGDGGQLFASLDRILDGIQASTDFTFGQALIQESREGYFTKHAASPTRLDANPFVPRDLLFKTTQSPSGMLASLPTPRSFLRETPLTQSPIRKSAPPKLAFKKLHATAEMDEEEEEASLLQRESQGGSGFSWGSVGRAQRVSKASVDGSAAALCANEDDPDADADEEEESEYSESKQGGLLESLPTRGERSWGRSDQDNVSTGQNGKHEKAWAKKSVNSSANRYSNYEPSPVTDHKAGAVLRSPSLDLSPVPIHRTMRSDMGRSSTVVFRGLSDSSEAVRSEAFGALRNSASVSNSVDNPGLIAEMARLLGQQQFEGSQQAPSESCEADSMSISAANKQESECDEDEDEAESTWEGFAISGANEKEEESLVVANSTHAGAVKKNAVGIRAGSWEESAAESARGSFAKSGTNRLKERSHVTRSGVIGTSGFGTRGESWEGNAASANAYAGEREDDAAANAESAATNGQHSRVDAVLNIGGPLDAYSSEKGTAEVGEADPARI